MKVFTDIVAEKHNFLNQKCIEHAERYCGIYVIWLVSWVHQILVFSDTAVLPAQFKNRKSIQSQSWQDPSGGIQV